MLTLIIFLVLAPIALCASVQRRKEKQAAKAWRNQGQE